MLATYTVRDDLDVKHKECTGACVGRRCVAATPLGAACTSAGQCVAAAACIAGKCAAVTPQKLGAACPAGVCEPGSRCVVGKCIAPKSDGEACAVDGECIGGCVKSAGAKTGNCGMRCDLR